MVSTPQNSGLATRFAAPARLLAARLSRLRPTHSAEPVRLADRLPAVPALLDGRVHVPVLDVASEITACAQISATYAQMAAEDRWKQLLDAMCDADQSRASAPGGHRLADLISRGARASLTKALEKRDWETADAEIDRFEAVRSAHPDGYGAAHLLAQAHLDIGWARRSAEPGPGVPRDIWQLFLNHTALAEAALDDLDPIQEMSPLLAGTRYFLVRGIEDGESLFRDWYEDWSDLDPTNPAPHNAHAAHLLPNWFGTLVDFDREARAAMARTAHCSGASAYAVLYLAAAETHGAYPEGMDLPLFLGGLMDFYRATCCQYRANIVAGALTELHHSYAQDAKPGSARLTVLRDALAEHLRENLREFHLPAWENGQSCIQYALEQVFAKELARGEHIYVGAEGLTSHLPA